MSFQIAQDFEYVGKDYWRWWSWIEADAAELDGVAEVIWILHPTFKQNRIAVNDRPSKFRLSTAGWGTFLLRAEVALENGEKRLLRRNLRLEYPTAENESSSKAAQDLVNNQVTVFLSYSAQDSRAASKLRESFKRAGVEVLDQTRFGAGEPLAEAMQRMISRSDAVVGLVVDEEVSPWVSAEMEAAAICEKPVFALLAPGASSVGIPTNARILQGDLNQFDAVSITSQLRSKMPD